VPFARPLKVIFSNVPLPLRGVVGSHRADAIIEASQVPPPVHSAFPVQVPPTLVPPTQVLLAKLENSVQSLTNVPTLLSAVACTAASLSYATART